MVDLKEQKVGNKLFKTELLVVIIDQDRGTRIPKNQESHLNLLTTPDGEGEIESGQVRHFFDSHSDFFHLLTKPPLVDRFFKRHFWKIQQVACRCTSREPE